MANQFRNAFSGFGRELLDNIRESAQGKLDDEAFEERIVGIENATDAMIEVGIEDDKIIKTLPESELSDYTDKETIDLNNSVLSPGFIDLQLNGCGGVLFNDDISRKTLEIMNETNQKYGCTSFLPTLITSPDEKILKSLINSQKAPTKLLLRKNNKYFNKKNKGIINFIN